MAQQLNWYNKWLYNEKGKLQLQHANTLSYRIFRLSKTFVKGENNTFKAFFLS